KLPIAVALSAPRPCRVAARSPDAPAGSPASLGAMSLGTSSASLKRPSEIGAGLIVQALLRNPVLCAPVALVLAIFLRAAERVAVGTPQDGAGFAGEFKTTLCVGHDGSGGFAST